MNIGISNHRLQHSLGVARYMYECIITHGGAEEYAMEMFTLGYLHDIGYEFTKLKTEHPQVGGLMLKQVGYKYWSEVYNHGNPFSDYESKELNLLNEADLSIGSSGELVGATKRLSMILDMYGKESSQYKKSKILIVNLRLTS